MSKKVLLCGNEAMAEAAIQVGCRYYYGYPITPQNEISAYMAKRMPEVDGTFIQAESELAAINMVFGTATTGKRVMTSTSSPGMSLKQEGMSYFAGCELPAVVINVMRAGPGLGGIAGSQADYFQATRGGGHGDYRSVVLAPASVQEAADLAQKAFSLADKYRIVVLLLLDGILGQMREPVVVKKHQDTERYDKSWCLSGCKDREPNVVRSLYLREGKLEGLNKKLQAKYRLIEKNEVSVDCYRTEDAETIIVAYGTPARMCRAVVDKFRERNLKVGLFRPISLWPFPEKILRDVMKNANQCLVVELSAGQLIEDVKLSIGYSKPIEFLGKLGGAYMTLDEIENKLDHIMGKNGARL